MEKNVQKGLQPVKVIPKIDVTGDSFGHFLRWLLDEKGIVSTDIINVVEQPHHWESLWEEYHDETK